MQVAIVIVVAIVIAVVVSIAVLTIMRRRSATSAHELGRLGSEPTDTRPADEPAPMNDLESALANVTDRDGRPIRDRIDAEAALVDELRVPDDTGPVLRRALDRVAFPAAATADDDESDGPDDPLDIPPADLGDGRES